jgi:hypothetical protein
MDVEANSYESEMTCEVHAAMRAIVRESRDHQG